MTLLDNIQKIQNYKFTENGASALSSSGAALLDLFATSGALRYRDDADITDMFLKAMAEDNTLATKLAFYTRDVRGGLGERRTARIMYKALAKYYPNIIASNAHLMAKYGRFDDLFTLFDSEAEAKAIEVIANQLKSDMDNMIKGKPISLLAKWLPSVNTSSYKTRKLANKLCAALKMSQKEYRKALSSLRAYLNVTEVRMSGKDYSQIKYDEVPSYAMRNYSNAFKRNDTDRFTAYIDSLKKGDTTINASTLYPYDIIGKYLTNDWYTLDEWVIKPDNMDVLEAQWRALPNYVTGDNKFLVMADVSGSMAGRPIATSIGLAMYFAERNKGAFANKFMTFSAKPKLVDIKGNTLFEKIRYMISTDWDGNTDLEAAFDLVLNTAIINKTPAEDMPTSIVIISDMEIDYCTNAHEWVFYDEVKKRFEANGYQIPNIVFWNVNARHNTFHADMQAKGVQLASGQSASVFKTLIDGVYMTPYEYMLSVLNTPRYEQIIVQS